ncbi:PucR family transcriptional regulator [Nakamurella lactea]|uniref:PucR family transcriptional regulator n=1 Tax=Nakamurella lactea TaxID=459515 RepID=UPI00040A4D85|nr:helix-turn-helix domain-containing protein [Nakamurella lactea]
MTTATDQPDDQPDDWPSRPSLGHILEHLGIRVLDIVAAPVGLDVPTAETVVAGPGEPIPDRPDGILLATGAGGRQTIRAIEAAGAAGYAAVVVKSFGTPTADLAMAAGAAGVALLTTPDDMSWRHLDALLGGATPTVGPPTGRFASAGLGDLFSLANAIAAAVGGALTIEDPHGRVLAYSNLPEQDIDQVRRSAILGRQTPDRPTNHEEYQAVFAHDGPISYPSPAPDHAARMAVGLWAGRRPLGILWVISDRPPVAPNALEILSEAGKVAELHLLRLRSHRDPDRLRRTEVLRDLLSGQGSDSPGRSELGLAPDTPSRILAIAATVGADVAPSVPARIVDLVTLFCDGWDPRALCVTIDGTVYALLPETGPTHELGRPAQPNRLRRLAVDIVSTARRSTDLDLFVGIGPVAADTSRIPASRHSADRVLRVLRRPPGTAGRLPEDRRPEDRRPQERTPDGPPTRPAGAFGRAPDPESMVAAVEDVQQTVALLAVADHLPLGDGMLLPAVQRLLDTDAGGGTPYVDTVLTYLGTMGDIARTAQRLTVHENTVRYRIRRAEELLGLDLTDPDTVLVSWLQLRLTRLTASTTG